MTEETASQPLAWRRRAGLALRVVVSLGLLAWLAYGISWPALLRAIAGASPPLVALSCALYYVGIWLSCWKWQTLLRVEGISVAMPLLVRWYLIGAFAGNFLPTDIGGDLGRGLLAGRATGRPAAVARSIVVERLSGLAALLALAWLGLFVVLRQPALALALAAAALIACAGALIAVRRAPAVAARLGRLRAPLAASAELWRRAMRDPQAVAFVAVLSAVFQLLAGVGGWLNLRAVGVDMPLLPVLLAAAIVGTVGLLPVSVNGWGVREGAYVALLAPLGADAALVVAGVLLGRALILLLSLPGAAALAAERRGERALRR